MPTIKSIMSLPAIGMTANWKISATLYTPARDQHPEFFALQKKENRDTVSIQYTPRVYLIIEPKKIPQGDNYFEYSMYFDAQAITRLKAILKELHRGFQTQNLYYFRNDVLVLNQELAKKAVYDIVTFGKTTRIAYTVIKDEENRTGDREGIRFFINGYNRSVAFNLDEMEFMMDILEQLNIVELGLSLIQASLKK